MHLVIVGGGISGLTSAYLAGLQHPSLQVTVLEADTRLGGSVLTQRVGGYLFEAGALAFPTNAPALTELIHALGLAPQLRMAVAGSGERYLFDDGDARPWPADLAGLVRSGLLTPWARARAALGWCSGWWASSRQAREESVFDFMARQLGGSAAALLAEASVFEISAGDPRSLSAAALFPRWRTLEQQHGSWLRGVTREARAARHAARDGRPQTSLSLAGGMQTLVTALTHVLGERVRSGVRVHAVRRVGERYLLTSVDGEEWEADALVLGVPAPTAARLLADQVDEAAHTLQAIPYAPLVVAGLGYDRIDLPHGLERSHVYLPRLPGWRVRMVQVASALFPEHAPEGKVALRVLAGGNLDPELLQLADDQLLGLLRRDLERVSGVVGEPEAWQLQRWPQAFPQYTLGHRSRLARAQRVLAERWPRVELSGAYLSGVGLADVVNEARKAVRRLLGPPRV